MRGDPRVEIGRVARAHGIRGELAIATHDADDDSLARARLVYVAGAAYGVAGARRAARGWLLSLAGVTDRDAAEVLAGARVEVDRDVVALADGEVLLDDLVGCAVRTAGGDPWGQVAAIDAGPLQNVLVIHDGDVERLVPYVPALVAGVDLVAGVVTVSIDAPAEWPTSKALPVKR